MPFQATLEWSSRSRSLQSRLRQRLNGVSFWLTPNKEPAECGIVEPQNIGFWPTAPTTPLPMATDLARQMATVTVPDGPAYVRLDFDLVATAGGQTSSVLKFTQLFLASSVTLPGQQQTGTLIPAQYAREDVVLVPSARGPLRNKGGSTTGFKVNLGLHPLVLLGAPGHLSVNTEFVDVTELWWKVHPDRTWGWYWHPATKGRQEHLRVLAWTGGGNPMIWFAAVPDASVPVSRPTSAAPGETSGTAEQAPTKENPSAATQPADIVFFRPPPGSNAFPYEPTRGGFEAQQHDDITLVNLARYLLGPLPAKDALALKSSGLRSAELLADQVQRVPAPAHPRASDPVQPWDPMWLMKLTDEPIQNRTRNEAFTDGRANAFRPVGLEGAVNRAGAAHVLFLPLGFEASVGEPTKGIPGNPQGGYEAVRMPGLKATVQSALSLLWNSNAIARDKGRPPAAVDRELWTVGHSEGNLTVWVTLQNNGKDIDRVLSFDTNAFDEGVKQFRAAGKARPKGKPIDVFVIMTPTQGGATGLTDKQADVLRELSESGVNATVIPALDKRAAYWHISPPPIANPYFLYLLAQWNVPAPSRPGLPPRTLLDMSALTPGNWNFLFFHELAIFGGDLIQAPAQSGGPAPAPVLRTFFEQALGAPNPIPPKPGKP